MNADDNAAGVDRDNLDGEEFAPDAPAAPLAEAEPVTEIDEELLEAELGEFDGPIEDDELDDLDEQLLDADEDEDDLELTLLQELGIDLDAPDAGGLRFDLGVEIDDDPDDEEVAA